MKRSFHRWGILPFHKRTDAVALSTESALKLQNQWKTSTSLVSLTRGFLLVRSVQAMTSDERQLSTKTWSQTPAPSSSCVLILEADWCSASCTCRCFASIRGSQELKCVRACWLLLGVSDRVSAYSLVPPSVVLCFSLITCKTISIASTIQ